VTRATYEQLNEAHFNQIQDILQQQFGKPEAGSVKKLVLTGSFSKTPKFHQLVHDSLKSGGLALGDAEKADERVVVGTVVRAARAIQQQ